MIITTRASLIATIVLPPARYGVPQHNLSSTHPSEPDKDRTLQPIYPGDNSRKELTRSQKPVFM
jgi:hypothetical protein